MVQNSSDRLPASLSPEAMGQLAELVTAKLMKANAQYRLPVQAL